MSRRKEAGPLRSGQTGNGFPSLFLWDAAIWFVFLLIAIKWD